MHHDETKGWIFSEEAHEWVDRMGSGRCNYVQRNQPLTVFEAWAGPRLVPTITGESCAVDEILVIPGVSEMKFPDKLTFASRPHP